MTLLCRDLLEDEWGGGAKPQGVAMDLSILVKLALIYGGRKQKKIYPKGMTRLKWASGQWSYLCQHEEDVV